MTLALVTDGLDYPARTASLRGELPAETLEAARRGDRAALETFVRTYQTPLFAFLSRLTGRGPHVEDLAQEVFLRAQIAEVSGKSVMTMALPVRLGFAVGLTLTLGAGCAKPGQLGDSIAVNAAGLGERVDTLCEMENPSAPTDASPGRTSQSDASRAAARKACLGEQRE